jgi:hypothetical protein
MEMPDERRNEAVAALAALIRSTLRDLVRAKKWPGALLTATASSAGEHQGNECKKSTYYWKQTVTERAQAAKVAAVRGCPRRASLSDFNLCRNAEARVNAGSNHRPSPQAMVSRTIREPLSEVLMAKCNAAGAGDLSQLSLLEYQK